MQALAGVAIATLLIVSVAVGVRLLTLHRKTGGMPELLLGLMLLLSVGLGYPLKIAATRIDPGVAGPVVAVSSLVVAVGFSCLVAFTWRVFRRDAEWARAVAVAGILVLLVTGLWDAIEALRGADVYTPDHFTLQSVIHGSTVMAVYLWTAWESLRYRGKLKRRLRLGMADPLVCNRLLLWGLMSLCVAGGILLNITAGVRGVSIVDSPGVLLGSSATGLAQTLLLVLAFAPPRAYLAWVRGPAEAEPA